jgi:hypothetical protein
MASEDDLNRPVCRDCGKGRMRNYADVSGCDRTRKHSDCAEATITRLRAVIASHNAAVERAEASWGGFHPDGRVRELLADLKREP